jgi:hypothetical protein
MYALQDRSKLFGVMLRESRASSNPGDRGERVVTGSPSFAGDDKEMDRAD